MGILSYQTFSNISALKIIGDVKTVLNGLVEEGNMQKDVLNQLKFALGAGSFTDCSCVGESLVLNKIGYSCYLDNHSELMTSKGSSGLKSPFLMGIEWDCQPSSLLQIDYPEGISLHELLENIGAELHAYAFVACLKFNNLACTYLKKAPIFKENINVHVAQYWAKTEEYPKCDAYLFGVVIKEKGKQKFPAEILEKAFYVNPQEKNKGSILSHSHAALVKEASSFAQLKTDLQFYEQLDPNSVIGVRHVFTQSIVNEGLFALFKITDIKNN